MKILQLNTSLFSAAGQSSLLADKFVAARRAADPQTEVVVRDLARYPVPHLTAERFQAFVKAETPEQREVLAYSDALIEELKDADTIVLGLPMYNFGLPSTLKAYFDHVARAGVTFKYTDKGAVGLLTGKKAYVFAARGGLYAGTPADTQTPYVRDFLGFLGIKDVEFVYAEGLAISPASKETALAKAAAAIDGLNERELAAI
jgi:FMN-dependent NADH-azoreductase